MSFASRRFAAVSATPIALAMAAALYTTGCAEVMAITGVGPSLAARKAADDVFALIREGKLEEAVDAAQREVDRGGPPKNSATRALSLQTLGLALARADRLDEARQAAAQLRGIAGAVSWMGVLGEVELQQCHFDEAAKHYLELREATPNGGNDAPTSGALATIDLAEGRTERAIESLEYALTLSRPRGFPQESWDAVQGELRRALASAYVRTGNPADAKAKLTSDDAQLLRRHALNTSDYALKTGRALYSAYRSLATALLAGEVLGASEAEQSELRDRVRAVLARYPKEGGGCVQAIPDVLAVETPGIRLRLSGAPAPMPNAAGGTPSRSAGSSAAPGAPVADADYDGIIDTGDRCPDKAEVYNGVSDDDGCPDQAPGSLQGREIRLSEEIRFAHDSDELDPTSSPTLDWLASFLAARPDIETVRVEGHTDDVGKPEYNLDLSRRRAKAIIDALAARSVAPSRLQSEGYGTTRPKLVGSDESARRANRRVEILVTLREGAAATPHEAPAVPQTASPLPAPAGTATPGAPLQGSCLATTENSAQNEAEMMVHSVEVVLETGHVVAATEYQGSNASGFVRGTFSGSGPTVVVGQWLEVPLTMRAVVIGEEDVPPDDSESSYTKKLRFRIDQDSMTVEGENPVPCKWGK